MRQKGGDLLAQNLLQTKAIFTQILLSFLVLGNFGKIGTFTQSRRFLVISKRACQQTNRCFLNQ